MLKVPILWWYPAVPAKSKLEIYHTLKQKKKQPGLFNRLDMFIFCIPRQLYGMTASYEEKQPTVKKKERNHSLTQLICLEEGF